MIVIMRISWVLFFAGAACAYMAFSEGSRGLSSLGSKPRSLTAAELAGGAGDSAARVSLTEVTPLLDGLVYRTSKGSGWQGAYVPALATGGSELARLQDTSKTAKPGAPPQGPDRFDVLFWAPDVQSRFDLERLFQSEPIEGAVLQGLQALDNEAHELLSKRYPKINFYKVRVVEIGRAPARWEVVVGYAAGCLACWGLLYVATTYEGRRKSDE